MVRSRYVAVGDGYGQGSEYEEVGDPLVLGEMPEKAGLALPNHANTTSRQRASGGEAHVEVAIPWHWASCHKK